MKENYKAINLYEVRDLNDDSLKTGLSEEYIDFCINFNTIINDIFKEIDIKKPRLHCILNIAMSKSITAKVVNYGDKTFKKCLDNFKTHIKHYKLYNLVEKVDALELKMNSLELADKYYHKRGRYSSLEEKLNSYNDLLLATIASGK